MNHRQAIIAEMAGLSDDISDIELMNSIEDILYKYHPFKHNPVSRVRYIPLSKIHANSYNPNSVAQQEMRLLHTSIKEDGYTMPVVTFYDREQDEYIIVDGFHRYTVDMRYKDINTLNRGYLPVVVIEKDLADRMASTVRHNRARGKHAVAGMSNIVLQMLKEGKSDAEVCIELGLEVDELIKLKHITGFAKLFDGAKYSNSWESYNQMQKRINAHDEKDEEEKL